LLHSHCLLSNLWNNLELFFFLSEIWFFFNFLQNLQFVDFPFESLKKKEENCLKKNIDNRNMSNAPSQNGTRLEQHVSWSIYSYYCFQMGFLLINPFLNDLLLCKSNCLYLFCDETMLSTFLGHQFFFVIGSLTHSHVDMFWS
jgi:hypothetical protein